MNKTLLTIIGSGLAVVVIAGGLYFLKGDKDTPKPEGKSNKPKTENLVASNNNTQSDSAKGNETEKPANVEKNNNAGYDVNIADHKKMGGVKRDPERLKKYENPLCRDKIGAGFTYLHSANVGNTAENNKNNLHRSILHGLATMNENEIIAGKAILVDSLTDYGNYSHNEKRNANELVNVGLNKIDEFTGYSLKGKRLEIVGLDKKGNCVEVYTENLNNPSTKFASDDGR